MQLTTRSERLESGVQLLILLLVGLMAGAASFTHVHNWTMANSPEGTGEWFGWANAVISELTPTASGLEVRRRRRNGQPIAYPMAVLIASAVLSVGAQIAVAKPHPTGWLIAAIPALAFLALTKLVLSRAPTQAAPALPETVLETTPEPAETVLDHEHQDDTTNPRTHQEPAPAQPTLPVLHLPTPALEGHH
jgi:peptidoglycan/LPS O-acetylase OafA/YrhL